MDRSVMGRVIADTERSNNGVDRRDFLKVCTMAAAAVGLPASVAVQWAEAAESGGLKPSVIWLHGQECTGCTESLLRTSRPGLAELILDLISLDYHETLFAAAGHQMEAALQQAMEANAGKYVMVVEGSTPVKENGIYCKIGGTTMLDLVHEVAEKAGAIIAIGSCASWGGVQSTPPNPTGATGLPEVLEGKTVVTIPGCPANPYNFLGTVLQFVTLGTLPALDAKGRPATAYSKTIHEHCPRRPHFDAGRFAQEFGDEGHRQGWCLYKLGCKGPVTHANCSVLHFGEIGTWPIGTGHPCIGCTEQHVGFETFIHQTVEIERPTPPDTYPPVEEVRHGISPAAAGVAGLVGGALVGAGYMAARKAAESGGEEEES